MPDFLKVNVCSIVRSHNKKLARVGFKRWFHLDLRGSVSMRGSRRMKLKAMWQAVSRRGKENQDKAHLLVKLRMEFRDR